MTHFLARAAVFLFAFTAPAMAEMRLVMIEQAGCAYCKLWNRDVSDAYANSPEGARAPLLRLDLRAPVPDDMRFAARPVFTPTFILIDNGEEIGRIEGYASAQFFWEHLGRLLDQAAP